jgi:hypothetical protein
MEKGTIVKIVKGDYVNKIGIIQKIYPITVLIGKTEIKISYNSIKVYY